MEKVIKKSEEALPASKQTSGKTPDIATASVADTLAQLKANPETGLSQPEADARRKEHGYNEVAEKKAGQYSSSLENFRGYRRGCSN
jgi:H+-transporting ATPase